MSEGTELATVDDKDFALVRASQNSKAVFLPTTLAEAIQLANFMAGGPGVRPWMRNNPSACLALIQMSMRWGLDPYIVSNKAYYTNDTIAFESQLVNAVINTSGQLIGRLRVSYAGDTHDKEGRRLPVGQETLNIRVAGRIKADPDDLKLLDQPLCDIKIRNSPLWNINPRLQLAYHATRSWARLHMPEVLLGIYTPDEIEDGAATIAIEKARDSEKAAPDRRSFVGGGAPAAAEPDDAEFEPVDATVEHVDHVEREEVAGDVVTGDGSGEAAPPIDDANPNEEREGAAIAPEPQPVQETEIPNDPDGWRAWHTEIIAEIAKAKDVDALNNLRRTHQPIMDAAADVQHSRGDELHALGDIVADAFADRIVELMGAGK